MMLTSDNQEEGGPLAAGLCHITELVGLRRLDLSWNGSLTSLEGIQAPSSLEELDLEHCLAIKSRGLAPAKDLPKLRRLILAGCTYVSPKDVIDIAVPEMQTLHSVGRHPLKVQPT